MEKGDLKSGCEVSFSKLSTIISSGQVEEIELENVYDSKLHYKFDNDGQVRF